MGDKIKTKWGAQDQKKSLNQDQERWLPLDSIEKGQQKRRSLKMSSKRLRKMQQQLSPLKKNKERSMSSTRFNLMLTTSIEPTTVLPLSSGPQILPNRLKLGQRRWSLMVRWRTLLLMRGQVKARTWLCMAPLTLKIRLSQRPRSQLINGTMKSRSTTSVTPASRVELDISHKSCGRNAPRSASELQAILLWDATIP